MSGIQKSSSELDKRRKKIMFRAWHRGMREVDLLLGPFCEANLGSMSEDQLDRLEHFMSGADQHIFEWFTGKRDLPEEVDRATFDAIQKFHEDNPAAGQTHGLKIPSSLI